MSPRNQSDQDLPEQDQRVQRHDEHPTRLRLHEPIVIIDVSENDTDELVFNRTRTQVLVNDILTDIVPDDNGTYEDTWLEIRH